MIMPFQEGGHWCITCERNYSATLRWMSETQSETHGATAVPFQWEYHLLNSEHAEFVRRPMCLGHIPL
jgi:hypothetical protein